MGVPKSARSALAGAVVLALAASAAGDSDVVARVFGAAWANGAGDAGDLFRLGDGNGDGRIDLFYARPTGMTSLTATPDLTQVRWYALLSTGAAFGPYTVWADDATDEGDIVPLSR